MDLSYLRKLYEEKLVAFHESFDTWQDAVLAAVEPMARRGMVTPEYGQGILRNTELYGPYIFLAPHVCMPHCNRYDAVITPGICFMKCNQPVIADPAEPELGAELFFSVAAKSEGEHLDTLKEVVDILDNEEVIQALLSVKTEEEFRELVFQNSF